MIALISDIHANLKALETILDRIGDARTIYCAGDIVGYGPNPNECCELLRERRVKAVQGNHDIVCANLGHLSADDPTVPEREKKLTLTTLNEMNSIAQRSCEWTHGVLTEENRRYLRELPLQLQEGKFTIIHGSPGADYHKLNTYLQEKYETVRSKRGGGGLPFTEFCTELLDEVRTKVLVVGHTHVPYKGYVFRRASLGGRALPFLSHENWVINPGSVGQPRTGKDATCAIVEMPLFPYLKPRASFHLLEHNVKHHYVPYDRSATLAQIEGLSALPEDVRFMLSRWF